MDGQIKYGRVSPPKSKQQLQLYQQLAGFCKNLDRLPDAREVSRDKLKPAPLDMLPIIF